MNSLEGQVRDRLAYRGAVTSLPNTNHGSTVLHGGQDVRRLAALAISIVWDVRAADVVGCLMVPA